jgi:hypothetical protein
MFETVIHPPMRTNGRSPAQSTLPSPSDGMASWQNRQ